MSIEWKNYKGKRVMYIDYQGCKCEQDLLSVLEEEVRTLNAATTKSLMLSNYTGASISTAYMDKVKQAGKALSATKIEKSALLGITGLKSILLQGYLAFVGDKNTKAFASESEALAWLVP